MVSGVKTRMVEAITRAEEDLPDFQVILFLTRSEIRDVEELLDDRAGSACTLSCSTHYPVKDLVHSWRSIIQSLGHAAARTVSRAKFVHEDMTNGTASVSNGARRLHVPDIINRYATQDLFIAEEFHSCLTDFVAWATK